jgi:hypothetical protein
MWSQPNGLLHLAGKETEFIPGQRMIAEPYEMHGFRNDTAQPRNPQGHRYTRWRPGPYSATLSGLSRHGLLVPGKPLGLPSLWRVSRGGPLLSAAVTQMA